MTRCHHLHLDVRGHSVTVNIYRGNICGGRPGAIELLVDGKETRHVRPHGKGPHLVTGELPTDPPVPVVVHVTPGPDAPRCTVEIDGTETPMSPRAY